MSNLMILILLAALLLLLSISLRFKRYQLDSKSEQSQQLKVSKIQPIDRYSRLAVVDFNNDRYLLGITEHSVAVIDKGRAGEERDGES